MLQAPMQVGQQELEPMSTHTALAARSPPHAPPHGELASLGHVLHQPDRIAPMQGQQGCPGLLREQRHGPVQGVDLG